MNYEEVKKLPEWLQELHGAAERMNLVVLSTPREHYEQVKALRDGIEGIWLAEMTRPRVTLTRDDEEMGT